MKHFARMILVSSLAFVVGWVQRDFYAPLMVFRRKERKGRKDYAEQATWGRPATRWLKNSSSRFDL